MKLKYFVIQGGGLCLLGRSKVSLAGDAATRVSWHCSSWDWLMSSQTEALWAVPVAHLLGC